MASTGPEYEHNTEKQEEEKNLNKSMKILIYQKSSRIA